MSSSIEPFYDQKEKKDEFEYSIPKILVAVLLGLFIAQTVYFFYSKKKHHESMMYLIDRQKSNQKKINFLTEKHNLAEDDIVRLEKELFEEETAFIEYRDSIKKRRSFYRRR